MKKLFIIMSVVGAMNLFNVETSQAVRIISFEEVNLTNLKYTNRVRVSNELGNFNFETDYYDDSNNDGVIDFLEEDTFTTHNDEFELYIGNASSRYNLYDVILWIGVDGTFDNFQLDELTINSSDFTPSNNPNVVSPYVELQSLVDSVILIDMEEGISKRTSIHDPISTCSPQTVSLSSLQSQDKKFRLYIAGLGSIKSGFNSYTPVNSDILWIPEPVEIPNSDNNSYPVPEAGNIWSMGLGFMILILINMGRKSFCLKQFYERRLK